jgi:GNAT superfamily N-acetyltransferase
MTASITIHRATVNDALEIAVMVGELLNEIMTTIGINVFNFSLDETKARLHDFIDREKYFVFVAQNGNVGPVGFIALFEGHALYAEGAFGIIPELFVRPEFRSKNVGLRLVEQAKTFGSSRGWKRLEVTTPPLPQFDKTLAFYEREEFAITGGRKLKVVL